MKDKSHVFRYDTIQFTVTANLKETDMHMIRTFHSIGQGAFYTEQFDDFTIVYDCGSDNNIPLIEKEIRNTFEKNQTIDAVFISHLHEDHVNGLEFLLDYCDVKKIFLPLINSNVRLSLHVYHTIEQTSISPIVRTILDFDENSQPNIGDAQIVFVPETGEDSKPELAGVGQNIENVNSGSLSQNPKIGLPLNINNWVFIPFNFRNHARSIELNNKLSADNLTFSNIDEFNDIWSDSVKREKLKDIYKSIPGSLNTNSLTLYSGPELNNGRPFRFRHFPFFRMHDFWYSCGGLYFGDYEAKGTQKWNQFIKHYDDYWDLVGTVQIPHHGSRHNYNREINLDSPKVSIISAGFSNRHRHPHASTVRYIIKDGGLPILITEKTGSRLVHEIIGI